MEGIKLTDRAVSTFRGILLPPLHTINL